MLLLSLRRFAGEVQQHSSSLGSTQSQGCKERRSSTLTKELTGQLRAFGAQISIRPTK